MGIKRRKGKAKKRKEEQTRAMFVVISFFTCVATSSTLTISCLEWKSRLHCGHTDIWQS